MALRWVSSRSLLMVLPFLLVSGLNQKNQGPGPFLRSKRANSFLLEEILQGNLERECLEEVCNYEEAREVFEDHHQTARFWASYYDGNQCESAPCGNGGNCTDLVGGFFCTCPTPFYGDTCELGPGSIPKTGPETRPELDFGDVLDSAPQITDPAVCQTSGPTSCEQLCTASEFSFTCSCMSGYKLMRDGRHCEPEVEFPCGQIPDQLQDNSSHSVCTNHRCPWQVSVLDSRGVQLCWGALLGPSVVLTSAHCLQTHLGPNLDPKQIFIRLSGQRKALQVRSVDVHNRFSLALHDYDLALLQTPRPLHLGPTLFHLCVPAHRDHAENVLMHDGKPPLIGAHGSAARYMSLEECRRNNVSHRISNKMFCLETEPGLDQGLGTKPGLNQDREIKPGLDQDQRTKPVSGQDQDWTLGLDQAQKRVNGSSNDWGNDRNTSQNNGQNQNFKDSVNTKDLHRQGLNTNETGLNMDKVHPHLDQPRPGLSQDHIRPTEPRPGQQRVDLTPNGPDQDNPDQLGQELDRSILGQVKPLELVVSGPLGGTSLRGTPLPGTPVVSIDRGTAYLVGLLTSVAPPGGASTAQVLVFTKVSRHMTWLQQRLGHRTPRP